MKKQNDVLIYLFILLFLVPYGIVMGQRKMEKMDRGVVAMPSSASQIYVSWRHFATDPDDIAYNVYYSTEEQGTYTKLNTIPITNSTNYTAALRTANSSYTFIIKTVLNEVEKDEPGSFTVPRSTVASRIVKDISFEPLPAGYPKMAMTYCWPADLNGDGKYDFVVDRQNYGEAAQEDGGTINADYVSPKVEAYTSEGKFLWRIDLGYNVKPCTGHNDMITAYDLDGDGKAEVLVAVSEGTTFFDGKKVTAGNGTVTDYRNRAGSAPQWISVVDGETGVELDRIALPLQNEIKTTNSDQKWKDISGHFIIAYLNGINPSLIYQYKNRQENGNFTGAHAAFSFSNKKLKIEWAKLFFPGQADFHQVRVADVDGDGYDEFVEGGYVLNPDGTVLNKHEGVVHGDRHTLADIDPDRPGLEHFFIQQDNPNTLGMGIADPITGEIIKGIYQSAVGDVARGLCAAFDKTRRGLQFWSMMSSRVLYDSKGKMISGAYGAFPCEPLWWGPELSRYHINKADNAGANLTIENYNPSSKSFGRAYSIYNENNGHGTYYFRGNYGGRAAFWGDILGDWREEMVCARRDDTGFVVLSTWDVTSHRQYTLMQNPAYRVQTTARGYYQTADVDFYMATDMPVPPISPVQRADLYYTGSSWIDNNDLSGSYTDGKSIMFDLRAGGGIYTLSNTMSPSRVWLMNPKGKDYTFKGTGKFTGSMDLIKSMQGDVILNGDHDYTGITRISEGRLFLNGSLTGKVQVDARGVIGGNATLKGGIVLETGLNMQGGRIEPGFGEELGTLTIVGNVDLPGRNNLAFDIDQTKVAKNDLIQIQGNFNVKGTDHSIVINPVTTPQAGILTLVTYTGESNATVDNFKVVGLEGIPFTLKIENKSIRIEITKPRTAGSVEWKGEKSTLWDFYTRNFLNGTVEDIFVPGDVVVFNDNAINKTVSITENMPASAITFNNNEDYKVSGDGVIGGAGKLTKTGTGKLSLLTEENTFTGGIEVDGSVLEVSSLKNGGLPSSIGASSSNASNWVMKNATLQTTSQMATDRSINVTGKLTVNNPTTNNSVLISGNITGTNVSLDVTGKGTLSLQGNNSSLKDVTVKDGLLFLATPDANRQSLGTAKITLEGGTLRMFDINTSGNTGTFSNAIDVPEKAVARWELPSRWGISSKLTGSGTITINAPYVRTDFNGNWSEFTGIIKFTGRDIRLNNASARNLENAEVNLEAYLYVASNGSGGVSSATTITLGALSGSGGLSGLHNYIIGNKGTNTTYSGIIDGGAGRLTKEGTGSLTLTGNNFYTGSTTIDGGKLILASTTGSATGTGAVTVNNTGILMGTGTAKGKVTVNTGGAIMPGRTESVTATLILGSDLILNEGAKMVVKTTNLKNDQYTIGGNLTLKGILEIRNLGDTYEKGRSMTIFTAKTISGNFDAIEPAVPAEGLMWDISRITEGIISVTSGTSINEVKASSIKVYPTLVDDVCVVLLENNSEVAKIELLNESGMVIATTKANQQITEINMSKYNAGLYFIKVTVNGEFAVYKISKK